VFDHVAGQPRILADDDAMAMLAALEHEASRLTHLERELRRDQPVGAAPNPVGTEIFAAHKTPTRSEDPPPGREASNARYNSVHWVIIHVKLKWLQKI